MKTKFKLSAIMLSIAISSGMAQAQTEKAVISAPEKVKEGNSFEREMTPLLREISKRKSQLELRRIERELAKIDEDEIKVQLEIEEKNKKNAQVGNQMGGPGAMGGDSSITFGGMQGGPMGGLMIPGQAPMGLPGAPNMGGVPGATPQMPGQSVNVNGIPGIPQVPIPTEKKDSKKSKSKKSKDAKEEVKEEVVAEEDLPPLVEVKVLMIYGFDGNLSAKIAAGGQGGYVIQKGDVMPDGRTVTEITPNFIEVKDVKNKLARGSSRIFVSSGEVMGSDSGGGDKNKGGNQDSTNAKPPELPSSIQSNPNLSVKDSKGFGQLSPKDQEALSATEAIMKSFNTGVTQSNKTLK